MTQATQQPAQALVIVPFPTMAEAAAWVDKVSIDYPSQPPLLATKGRESVLLDPNGEAHYELCFEGGWRAKVADSHAGVVVITRATDAESASLYARSSDGRG